MLGKIGLLLIEIDGDEIELHGGAALQRQQDVEQCVRVLATGQTHHDAIAVGDHPVVVDGFADVAAQLRLQPLEGARGFDRCHGVKLT